MKTALVTGGSSGIGLSIVRALIARGDTVHFVGASAQKGRRVERELNAQQKGRATFHAVDLSRAENVSAFAKTFASDVEKLDLLANVAGVVKQRREENADGIELTIAVDVVSALILSEELRAMLARARGRIVNVSGPYKQVLKTKVDLDDVEFKRGYSMMGAVQRALHIKAVLSVEHAEMFRTDGIDVIAFDPGAVSSDLARNMKGPLKIALQFAQLFMPSESKTGIFAATHPSLDGTTGEMVVGDEVRPLALDPDYRAALLGEIRALANG